jgi:hypothetical protein
VQRVRAAEFTMFFHFNPVGVVLFVFLGVVVALLASLASHCDFNSHNFSAPPVFVYLERFALFASLIIKKLWGAFHDAFTAHKNYP